MEKQINLPDYHKLFHKKVTNITECYRYHAGVKDGLTPYLAALPHDAQTAYEGLISYIQFDIEQLIGKPKDQIDSMLSYLTILLRKYQWKIDLSGDETIVNEYHALTKRWGEITQSTPTQAHIREMERRLFDFYKEYLVGKFMN